MVSTFRSRRSLLKSGVVALGVGASAAGKLLTAAERSRRSLVCIYLLGSGNGRTAFSPLDKERETPDARLKDASAIAADALLPLGQVRDLFNSRVLAVIANIGDSADGPEGALSRFDSALAYLADGFLTLQWAARMGGANAMVFTQFGNLLDGPPRSNTSLIVPQAALSTQLGRQIAAAARDSASVRTSFPPTVLGQQLLQVARVLASGLAGGVYACPVSVPAVSGDPAARERNRLEALTDAMAAFYDATLELGVANTVTTFTLSESARPMAASRANNALRTAGGIELAMGGSVRGGEVYGAGDATNTWTRRERYIATLANWFGVSRTELNSFFPGLHEAGQPPLDFL